VKELLQKGEQYTMVAVVHCETSTGVINPIEELGKAVKQCQPQAFYFVDAMSSFGAVPINIQNGQIDYLVSSANKCFQGVPGFSYVIARKSELLKCKGMILFTFKAYVHQGREALNPLPIYLFTFLHIL
jgi:2-aminoethylphosphonate-pyruvate transaminase